MSFALFDKVDGLDYELRKIVDIPFGRYIIKRFDMYEIYFENKSDKVYSIPGYSIDLGVNYNTFDDVNSYFKDKTQKKLAFLNIAAGAASIAFGGIPRIAAGTAVRSVDTFRKKNNNIVERTNFLAPNRTYILYPKDSLSLFLFIDKELVQVPTKIRFICREEGNNFTYVVINNNIGLIELSGEQEFGNQINNSESGKNLIAAPETDLYK